MNRKTLKYLIQPIIVTAIVIFLCLGNWYYNNAFVLLKPVQTTSTGEPIIVPYTDAMIKNFPGVFKEYGLEYKMNDSGHFLVRARYMCDVNYILSITTSAIDK